MNDIEKLICQTRELDSSYIFLLLITIVILVVVTVLYGPVKKSIAAHNEGKQTQKEPKSRKCPTCWNNGRNLELRVVHLESKLDAENSLSRANIDSLLTRIKSLEDIKFLEAKEFVKLIEERRRRLAAEIIRFDVFSTIKSHHHRSVLWDKNSNVLTYSGPDTANSFASSSLRLPCDRAVQWRMKILNLPHNWLWVGIIGELDDSINDAASYWHRTAYGWACGSHVWMGGTFTAKHGDWNGWKEEDCAVFMYDPDSRIFSMRLERKSSHGNNSDGNGSDCCGSSSDNKSSSRTSFSYTIENVDCEKAYIHCHFYYPGTCVQFSGTDSMI